MGLDDQGQAHPQAGSQRPEEQQQAGRAGEAAGQREAGQQVVDIQLLCHTCTQLMIISLIFSDLDDKIHTSQGLRGVICWRIACEHVNDCIKRLRVEMVDELSSPIAVIVMKLKSIFEV